MAAFEAWLVILVVNVVGELQRKRTLAASRGFLAAARLSYSVLASVMYAGSYTFVKYIATNTQRICYFLPGCPFVCLSVTASVRIRRLRPDLLETGTPNF